MEREFDDNSGSAAAEGTAAHTLCEYKLRTALGEDMSQVADIREHLDYYNAEMEACADGYVQFILEQVAAAKMVCTDPMVLIEQKLDFSKYVPEGFGTGDCVIIADGTLHIVDYKHGQGVLVDAEENPQMKLYALGALELFDGIYDISTVAMTIYQPRRDNVSTFIAPKESLYRWAEEILIPTAAEAFEGNGEYRCGEWCQFCRAKNECRTRAEHNMAIQAAYDEGQAKLKGNGKSIPPLSSLKTPLRDGDAERPDDPAYADAYFINANSATAPGIVDANCDPILDRSEVYSGVYGRASVNFYAFNSNGNRGIPQAIVHAF